MLSDCGFSSVRDPFTLLESILKKKKRWIDLQRALTNTALMCYSLMAPSLAVALPTGWERRLGSLGGRESLFHNRTQARKRAVNARNVSTHTHIHLDIGIDQQPYQFPAGTLRYNHCAD